MTEQQNALTPRQAAKYLGISDGALRLWRSRGEGPRYFRAGGKLVRYRRSDLDACGNSRSAISRTEFTKGFLANDQRPTTNDRFIENPVEQALRAADLLLQSGGFGLIAIDLAGVPVKIARRIPLTTWFRFRRAIEPTPTILLAIGEQPCAQTCATLSLQFAGQKQFLRESDSSLVVGRWSLGKKLPA